MLLYGAPPAPELVRAFECESATFREFASRADPPLEPLEIPYEGEIPADGTDPGALTNRSRRGEVGSGHCISMSA